MNFIFVGKVVMKYTALLLFTVLLNHTYCQLVCTHLKDFTGSGRFKTASFVVNGKGYMVCGRTNSTPLTYVSECWEYNPSTETWAQKAAFPYAASQPVGFAVGNRGYVLGGQDQNLIYANTLYEYNANNNTWVPKSPFPENGVGGCFHFVINNKAYVGTGARNNANNSITFYEYNPATDTWTNKADFPGSARVNAVGFSIGNFGYAGLGTTGSNVLFNDFYKYDPSTNSWSSIAPFPGRPRFEAMAFTIDGKGYVGGGVAYVNGCYIALGDFYEYDPVTNKWTPVTGIAGPGRGFSAVFAVNNNAYLVGGNDYIDDTYYKFIERFTSCREISTENSTLPPDEFSFNLSPILPMTS
ncbi:MAG: hypothetical protein NZM35_10065 [Chitinophagales bacterium]|nr:hypothetical protein [Chitinophagales bacterium]MDW8419621.1 kelch repeat-containing protein [Chitinophagales bacterium]